LEPVKRVYDKKRLKCEGSHVVFAEVRQDIYVKSILNRENRVCIHDLSLTFAVLSSSHRSDKTVQQRFSILSICKIKAILLSIFPKNFGIKGHLTHEWMKASIIGL